MAAVVSPPSQDDLDKLYEEVVRGYSEEPTSAVSPSSVPSIISSDGAHYYSNSAFYSPTESSRENASTPSQFFIISSLD